MKIRQVEGVGVVAPRVRGALLRALGLSATDDLPAEEFRRLIRELRRTPVERSTTYEILRRFDDPAADPPSLEPQRPRELSGPTRWRLGEQRPTAAASY